MVVRRTGAPPTRDPADEGRWPADFVAWDEGRLVVRKDAASMFERLGWRTAADVLDERTGDVFRRVDERENGRVLVADPAGGPPRVLYLKRHRSRRVWPWLASMLRGRRYRPPGLAEADSVGCCQRAGVPTLSIVAAGALRVGAPWEIDSFFLSEEIPGGRPADDVWRDGPLTASQQKEILDAIAQTARRLHAARLFHRDFYWCHFFLRRAPAGGLVAHLIDLQRVRRARILRGRWLLKDLAQFLYSAPEGKVRDSDLRYWFARYLGVQRLGWAGLAWYRIVRFRASLYRWREGPA